MMAISCSAAAGSIRNPVAQRSPQRDWLEYILARMALGSLAYGPWPLSFMLAWCYAQALRLAVPKLSRIARQNLEMAGLPGDLAGGVWRSIALHLVVFARMGRINASNVHEWIRYEGFERFTKAKAAGKGVLLRRFIWERGS